MIEFVAPQRVYKERRIPAGTKTEASGYTLGAPLGLAKTKTGGMATWFAGHPYPRKTYIYAGITQPNNKAKRVTLSLFLPFASLKNGVKAFLNEYLYNYNRLIESIYNDLDQTPYLHYQYYSEFGKSLWDFIYLFFKRLGVKDDVAYRVGLNVTTMIEYDDAYKDRLQDILNESDKEAWLKNPRKEMLRLIEIFKQRDMTFFDENNLRHAGARIVSMMKLLSFMFYIPPVKTAFKFAIKNINFEWFKCDELDYYWMLKRGDYNVFGKSFEERKEEGVRMMMIYAHKLNPGKVIGREDLPDGSVKINILETQ